MHALGIHPNQALEILLEGNERFAAGRAIHPRQDTARRAELLGGQKPFAVILCCSDSRVAPEIIFDQGLGDLFVIRTAGNVADTVALGSIEYAVEHLGSRLVVVLGHQKCGAVTAAVQSNTAPGHVDSIVKAILPAVAAAQGKAGDLVWNAAKENVKRVVAQISSSEPILSELVRAGTVQVIGAMYYLDSGKVELV